MSIRPVAWADILTLCVQQREVRTTPMPRQSLGNAPDLGQQSFKVGDGPRQPCRLQRVVLPPWGPRPADCHRRRAQHTTTPHPRRRPLPARLKLGFNDERDWEEDADLRQQAAARSTKTFKGKAFLMLSFSSLGVIYGARCLCGCIHLGRPDSPRSAAATCACAACDVLSPARRLLALAGDLGTSPLYAFSAVFRQPPSVEEVGGLARPMPRRHTALTAASRPQRLCYQTLSGGWGCTACSGRGACTAAAAPGWLRAPCRQHFRVGGGRVLVACRCMAWRPFSSGR